MNRHSMRLHILAACLVLLIHGAGCQRESVPEAEPQTAPQGSTTAQVCRIAAELMNIPASSVKPSTSLGDLNADELDFVELVMELEEHFNITISDETGDQLLGTNREAGLNQVTMAKLAAVVDESTGGGK